jgi:two-component system sensor histidine kinase QseC
MPTELTQVVAAMNQLLQAIEQHMQREKRFIADASHELRTPLSIIYLHAQNLAQSTLTDEQRHAVNAVKLGSERMTHLTNQLLALARLEQPKLDIQSLSLADLLDSSLHLLSADLLARVVWQIDTKFQQPKVAYQIRADRSLMQVAMRNILENAAKYAPFDSDVVIAVELLSMTQLQLTISNHCEVTIQLNRLGERFYRTSEHQSIAGSGLGLSIVCRIMALHHFQLDFTVIEQQFTAKIIMPFSE